MSIKKFVVSLYFVMMSVPGIALEVASTDYASNANNLSSGTVSVQRLPVGTAADTVAVGNDSRFNSVPNGKPTDNVDNTRVLIWVE